MYLILLDLVCGTFTSSGSKTWHAFLSQFHYFYNCTIFLFAIQMISYKKILCLTDPIQLSFNTQTCYTLKIKTPMYFLKVRRSL